MGRFGFRSCCAFPHGVMSLYALFLGISSSLLALSSTMGCYFVQVDFVFVNNRPEKISSLGTMTMGLLSYEDITSGSHLQCTSYSVAQKGEFDGFFKAAQVCALLANTMLGVSVLLLICMSCLAVRSSVITLLSGVVLVGGFMQALTFLVFFSSFSCDDCQISIGAGLALIGTVVTMINGAVVCHIPEASLLKDYSYDDDLDDDELGKRISRRKRISNRPLTPRPDQPIDLSASTSSSNEDEFRIPDKITVYDREVVLVLPDGSKQVIETIEGSNNKSMCSTGCSVFPDTSYS